MCDEKLWFEDEDNGPEDSDDNTPYQCPNCGAIVAVNDSHDCDEPEEQLHEDAYDYWNDPPF